jgi:ferredoxin
MINLKSKEGLLLFRTILAETVEVVKKYKGSLSGEHGDGRLRGEYISSIMGNETYELFKQVKQLFDPNDIFNKGKITGSPAMDSHLRIKQGQQAANVKTNFYYSTPGGMLGLAEKCSGSGDCRKSQLSGGVMCPSYMATRNEKDTTRARANVLRQFLSNSLDEEPLNHEEIKEVLDLCISCKGCKSECPSGVDIAKMKAEFLQHYYDKNGVPFRSKLIGNFATQMKLASKFPSVYNIIFSTNFLRKTANRMVGFHAQRSMPLLSDTTLGRGTKSEKHPIRTARRKCFSFAMSLRIILT